MRCMTVKSSGCYGSTANYGSACRLQGMLDYAKEHKIKIDKDDIWYGSFDYKSGLEGYKHLWDRHKESHAVICMFDNGGCGM